MIHDRTMKRHDCEIDYNYKTGHDTTYTASLPMIGYEK